MLTQAPNYYEKGRWFADADYEYVGTRPGKIHLYKEKTVVKKNVPEAEAVEALIDLIKEHGDWMEPR